MSEQSTPKAVVLALDASSVMLGYVLYDGAVLAHGEHELAGADIAVRCQTAYDILTLLLERWPAIDAIAIESPVARFAKAVIPQARVSGALLTCAAQRWKPVIEVTPGQGKKALCGCGSATKTDMQVAALQYRVAGEHASDALGIALSAAKIITVEWAKEAA